MEIEKRKNTFESPDGKMSLSEEDRRKFEVIQENLLDEEHERIVGSLTESDYEDALTATNEDALGSDGAREVPPDKLWMAERQYHESDRNQLEQPPSTLSQPLSMGEPQYKAPEYQYGAPYEGVPQDRRGIFKRLRDRFQHHRTIRHVEKERGRMVSREDAQMALGIVGASAVALMSVDKGTHPVYWR